MAKNSNKKHQKFIKHKNVGKKRPKIKIEFDPDERKEYLTGFQKRKADRKMKAREEMANHLREEKIRLRQKRKENMDKLLESQQTQEVPQELTETTVTYELPKQMVSITTFDAKEVSGSLGLSLGHNSGNDIKSKKIKKK